MSGCFSQIKRAFVFPKLSPMQKTFGKPKGGSNRNNYPKRKIANTGDDPEGCVIDFIKREIVKSPNRVSCLNYIYNRDSDSDSFNTNETMRMKKRGNVKRKWVNLLSDQNSNSKSIGKGIADSSEGANEATMRTFNSPASKPNKPLIIQGNPSRLSFIDIKSHHGSNIESKHCWSPQCNDNSNSNLTNNYFDGRNNRNSVQYNIISHVNNALTGPKPLLIHLNQSNNIRKGICEFKDLTNPFYLKHNQEFVKESSFHNETPKQFYNLKGIFTHMYDFGLKNGVLPFKRINSTKTLLSNY